MSQITLPQTEPQPSATSLMALRWANGLLVATVWASSILFGLYILGFFVAAALGGQDLSIWNTAALPDLYEEGEPAATLGIGVHFGMGAVILILGSVQLIEGVRVRFPRLHRWFGRMYVFASILTAIGGFTFIFVSGTVGGLGMNVGFGLYGVLMFVSAVETARHARAGRFDQHRAWSWRLYALAIGSWLYRMEYGFWFQLMGEVGIDDFFGWFDQIMYFFFYIPNLILVEFLLRSRRAQSADWFRYASAAVLLTAAVLVGIGTYAFWDILWGDVILASFGLG